MGLVAAGLWVSTQEIQVQPEQPIKAIQVGRLVTEIMVAQDTEEVLVALGAVAVEALVQSELAHQLTTTSVQVLMVATV